MSAKRLVMVGAGGHAKVALALARTLGYEVVAIQDDDEDKHGSALGGVPVVAAFHEVPGTDACLVILALGDNRARQRLATLGPIAPALVHPHAWVAPDVQLGAGTLIFAGAVVQPGARIGEHVIVNTGATVDHDCEIGSFAHVAPGVNLSGGVRVAEGALLGVGSAVVNGVRIGRWAVLGAGGVAVRDVPDGATAIGVPARVVEEGA